MTPIWKDYTLQYDGYGCLFDILDGGSLIYEGFAYALHDASDVRITINDIVRDYLTSDVDTSNGLTLQPYLAHTFGIILNDESQQNVTFVNDRSYDRGFDADTTALSQPLTGEIDRRMPIWFTMPKAGNITINNGVAQTIAFSGAGTWKGSQQSATRNSVRIAALGRTYDYPIVGDCYRYALYYVNAYGGWDALLMKGNCTVREDYDRLIQDVSYNNNLASSFGRISIANRTTRQYVLNTGVISEDASSRMWHLTGSTMMYLLDIPAGEFIAVDMVDASIDLKTFKGEGGKPISYTLTVRESQTRIR